MMTQTPDYFGDTFWFAIIPTLLILVNSILTTDTDSEKRCVIALGVNIMLLILSAYFIHLAPSTGWCAAMLWICGLIIAIIQFIVISSE